MKYKTVSLVVEDVIHSQFLELLKSRGYSFSGYVRSHEREILKQLGELPPGTENEPPRKQRTGRKATQNV